MQDLTPLVEAAGPALAPYAASAPPRPSFHGLTDPTRAFVIEAVHEGYLLHYGASRAFEIADPDLRLLAGDALYALGLSRLAQAGDLEAVAELSDLISRSARAHAEGRGDEVDGLWEASAGLLAGPPR